MKRIELETVLACLRFQLGKIKELPKIQGVNIYRSDGLIPGRLFSYLPMGSEVRAEDIIGLATLNLWMEENRKLGYEENSISIDEIRMALSRQGFDLAKREAVNLIEEYKRLSQEGIDLLRDELYPLSLAEKKEDLKEGIERFNEIEKRMNKGAGEFFGFFDYFFLRGQDDIGWRLSLYQTKVEAAEYLCQFLEIQKSEDRGQKPE